MLGMRRKEKLRKMHAVELNDQSGDVICNQAPNAAAQPRPANSRVHVTCFLINGLVSSQAILKSSLAAFSTRTFVSPFGMRAFVRVAFER